MGPSRELSDDEDEYYDWAPEHLMAWIVRLRNGEQPIPSKFNWPRLANFVTDRTFRTDLTSGVDTRWLPVAAAVLDFIVTLAENGERASRDIAAMMLRARAIGLLGAVQSDPILDPEVIRLWFVRSLPMSLDEALARSQQLRLMEPSQREVLLVEQPSLLRDLRRLKNRLMVVEQMARVSDLLLDPNIEAWLAARSQLP
jgi:hypothetical protein